MNSQQFSLKWNDYTSYVAGAFGSFRYEEDFVDVTLCCEGRKIRAHKILLSACSPYFKEVFKENPCQHPVIIFKNVRYADLLSLIEFMYHGEVNVLQDQLSSFLNTAELLAIRGLTDNTSDVRQSATTSAIAQHIIQSQTLDNKPATLTTTDSLYLTLPTIVQQPKLVQAQIAATPIITKPLRSAPPEMPPLAKASSVTVPLLQQQPTLVKMQVQASPQQQIHQVQQAQQQYQQQTTPQIKSQNQSTQVTTLQEVVENVVQSPKKKKIKIQHVSTTATVTTPSLVKSDANEICETDSYTDTRPEQEAYAESGQQTADDMPELITVPIDAETFALVSNKDEKRDGEETVEVKGSEMDVNSIFQQTSPDGQTKVKSVSVEKERLRSDAKLHKCPDCRLPFCSINAMKRHRQAKHLELSSSYECAMCDARFKTKWSLSTHKSKYHRGQNVTGAIGGDARTDSDITSPVATGDTSPTQKQLTTSTPLARRKTRRLSTTEDS
uniref:BTB domain-containing protein n=1 Tax=Anopheles culicifacies TaxID=139723 RepID=A0A182MLR6_9DIPT